MKPYFDEATSDEQRNALGQIFMGQAGGTWFEVVASIVSEVKEPAVVSIDFDVSGLTGTIRIGDTIENRFAPIKNPVTGEDTTVRVTLPLEVRQESLRGVPVVPAIVRVEPCLIRCSVRRRFRASSSGSSTASVLTSPTARASGAGSKSRSGTTATSRGDRGAAPLLARPAGKLEELAARLA